MGIAKLLSRTKCCKSGSSIIYASSARIPEVPWKQIIAMRNILVHSYFEIDTDIVWNTVQQHIPVLKASVEALLRRLQNA